MIPLRVARLARSLAISSAFFAMAMIAPVVAAQSKSVQLSADVTAIEQAVNTPDRLQKDKERDLVRKPVALYSFAGVRPGMHVLDWFSGSGYNSEILGRIVGPSGEVLYHQNETTLLIFDKDAVSQHRFFIRQPQVKLLLADNNEMILKPNSLDLIFTYDNFHDLGYIAPEVGWNKFDPQKLLKEWYKGLKPGGVVVIADHIAPAGMPLEESGQKLHRVDPELVKKMMKDIGFVFEADSDLYRNSTDEHTKLSIDPSILYKTDRFLFRFRKPAK